MMIALLVWYRRNRKRPMLVSDTRRNDATVKVVTHPNQVPRSQERRCHAPLSHFSTSARDGDMQPSLVVSSLTSQQIDCSHHDQKEGGVAACHHPSSPLRAAAAAAQMFLCRLVKCILLPLSWLLYRLMYLVMLARIL